MEMSTIVLVNTLWVIATLYVFYIKSAEVNIWKGESVKWKLKYSKECLLRESLENPNPNEEEQ